MTEENINTFNRLTAGLTLRQAEVMMHLADGLSAKAVADKLSISWRTVDAHRRDCLQKLGVHSTIEFMAQILRG
jgi:DNA-binding NarL/FixJ family response regulator